MLEIKFGVSTPCSEIAPIFWKEFSQELEKLTSLKVNLKLFASFKKEKEEIER